MAIKRQQNWLGQQRVDVPHLKSVESAIANDFDLLAGKILGGKNPLILKGFTISTANTLLAPVENLQLNVAGGILMHYGASEAGTIFSVADDAAAQVLSPLNSKVIGSFTAGVTNYVGLDLFRSSDTSTSDLVQFYDVNTAKEAPETVPLARTMQYKIIITTQNFTVSSNIVPIAKVVTNSSNQVVSITDARKLMFRLGSGGDIVNATAAYPWGSRTENSVTYTGGSDSFTGEDKSITSLKSWLDMAMTTIWEAKGGEKWYSPASRDNVKLTFGLPTIVINNDNFYFPFVTAVATKVTRVGSVVTVTATAHQFINGQVLDVNSADPDFASGTRTITGVTTNTFTYTESGAAVTNASTIKYSSLVWSGLGLAFENSGSWFNTITASGTTGAALPDGGCLYVDLVRESSGSLNPTVIPAIAPLISMGYSSIPGRRVIIAWRIGDNVFVKDKAFEVGRFQNPVASNIALGVVKLSRAASTPTSPIVISDTGGTINSGASIGLDITSSTTALSATGSSAFWSATFTNVGSGLGLIVSGGSLGGAAFGATSGNGYGSQSSGFGSGNGVEGIGGATGNGVKGTAGGSGGYGVWGISTTDFGVFGTGGAGGVGGSCSTGFPGVSGSSTGGNGSGGIFSGNGTGRGLLATGGATNGSFGVDGTSAAVNGNGVKGRGTGTGVGVQGDGGGNGGTGLIGNGGGTNGTGVIGNGGATNGLGGIFTGAGTGHGLTATSGGGATGNGLVGTSVSSSGYGVRGISDSLAGIRGEGNNVSVPGGSFLGGASGFGLISNGGSSAPGGLFTGGSNAAGVRIVPGTSSSIGADMRGHVDMSSAPGTASGDSFTNTLTKDNICKAWAVINIAAGTPTILSGQAFNINAITGPVGNTYTVTFNTSIVAPYMIMGQIVNYAAGNLKHVAIQSMTNSDFQFVILSADGSTPIVNPSVRVHFFVQGRQ
jgi:hypothetical protein